MVVGSSIILGENSQVKSYKLITGQVSDRSLQADTRAPLLARLCRATCLYK